MDTQQLQEKMEDLRYLTRTKSVQDMHLISLMEYEGIEFISSQLNRQIVVVWIWCHSEAAFDYVKDLYGSNDLTAYLFGIAHIRPFSSENIQSIAINIDDNEFKRKFGKFLKEHS